jgi:hypothetical protein
MAQKKAADLHIVLFDLLEQRSELADQCQHEA